MVKLKHYLEGTLSSKDTRDVDAHLQHCVHCQTLLAQEKAISEKLHQWPELTCPESVIEEVFHTIDERRPRVSWKIRIQWWFAPERFWKIGVAAAIVLLVCSFCHINSQTDAVWCRLASPDAAIALSPPELFGLTKTGDFRLNSSLDNDTYSNKTSFSLFIIQ